jgi:MoaA/NifB/PqqE/SkfB family radical SAM enzyme
MYNVNDIRELHIELTDKCQAQCPMCARNYNGNGTRDFIENKEISLTQFKEWFPEEFLAHLDNFYSCGNYGDPAFASDCLEIFAYVRKCNPTAKMSLHTNGGMRNPRWWKELAQFDIKVIFAVDGFKGKHELYRKNTKFDKVIENLKAFVNAGGIATVDSLVFAHNENDVDDLEKYLLDIGVDSVNFISTTRFYEMEKFDVYDETGIIYSLHPAQSDRFKKQPDVSLSSLLNNDFRNKLLDETDVSPRCVDVKGIYVDPRGNIYPCCLIGHDYIEDEVKEVLPIHTLHNISIKHTKEVLNKVGLQNCKDKILYTNGVLFKDFDKTWTNKDKCPTCAKACSNVMYKQKRYDQ